MKKLRGLLESGAVGWALGEDEEAIAGGVEEKGASGFSLTLLPSPLTFIYSDVIDAALAQPGEIRGHA